MEATTNHTSTSQMLIDVFNNTSNLLPPNEYTINRETKQVGDKLFLSINIKHKDKIIIQGAFLPSLSEIEDVENELLTIIMLQLIKGGLIYYNKHEQHITVKPTSEN